MLGTWARAEDGTQQKHKNTRPSIFEAFIFNLLFDSG